MERKINSRFVFTSVRTKRKHLLRVVNDFNYHHPCEQCFFSKFNDCERYTSICGMCNKKYRTDQIGCHFKLIRSQQHGT